MRHLTPAITAGLFLGAAGAAQAELQVCNDSDRAQSLSVAYEGGDGLVSEGWWNIEPGDCVVPIGGDLGPGPYYLRAEHKAGPFRGGGHFFCTSPEVYTVEGSSGCSERGYDSEDFLQIDTGGAASFTYTLAQAALDVAQSGDGLGLEFCNDTNEEHSVAVGYDGPDGWTSEGWWNIEPGACKKPLKDVLRNQYYYYRTEVRAEEFEGGEGYSFCTSSEAFTIVGDTDCEARGYETEDFAELDTGPEALGYSFTITSRAGGRPTAPVPGAESDPGTPTASGGGEPGLNFCNETDSPQAISIGYEGPDGWTSEGWWNVDPGDCAKPLPGPLPNRYYYYRAEVDGGDFDGGGYGFCTTPEAYEIVGDTECEARGYVREDFAEIDIGAGADRHTLTLTASNSGQANTAGLNFCNDGSETLSLSIGFEGPGGWTSQGWWVVDPGACSTPISGPLPNRYYYYRAEGDGGAFDGENYTFCTTDEAYEIVGDTDCEARGYEKETFREIDIGAGATTYTLTLAAPAGGDGTPSEGDATVTDVISETSAGIEVCNETTQAQSVSFGYEGAEGWTSEGWWIVEPGACATPELDGQRHRYLYYRAEVDGGDFEGQNYFFCTSPDAYTIVGDSDCDARGYAREDFREIDIGTEGMFTLALVGAGGGAVASPTGTDTDSGSGSGSGETTLGDRTGGTLGTAEPEPDTTVAGDTGADTPDTSAPSENAVGLAFCNEDTSDRFISVGYEGAEGWTSEGWWIVAPGECTEPELDGQRHRYVYYRAETEAGAFSGEGFSFCVTEDAFSIVGDANCEARGYETADFSEFDIGDTGMYTVTLAASETAAPAPEPAPAPAPEPEPAPENDGSFGGDFGGADAGDTGAADPGDEAGSTGSTGSTGTTGSDSTGGTGGFDFGDSTPEPDTSAPEPDTSAPEPDVAPAPEPDDAPANPRRGGSRGG